MNTEQIIQALGLKPHPEGGWYSETYRSAESAEKAALPDRYGGNRSHSTAIYYLLTANDFSAMHRIKSDEIFHFYAGDPVSMLQLHPDGTGEQLIIGPNLEGNERPQVIVPRGVWQGLRLVEGGSHVLLGCTVAPGFDFADFDMADRETLVARHPAHAEEIQRLTRSA